MNLQVTLPATLPTAPQAAAPHARETGSRPTSAPRGRTGRPFFTDAPIGALAAERGLKMFEVVVGTKINPRTMSDYNSLRKPISAPHRLALARFFGVPVETFDSPTEATA